MARIGQIVSARCGKTAKKKKVKLLPRKRCNCVFARVASLLPNLRKDTNFYGADSASYYIQSASNPQLYLGPEDPPAEKLPNSEAYHVQVVSVQSASAYKLGLPQWQFIAVPNATNTGSFQHPPAFVHAPICFQQGILGGRRQR